MDTKVQVTGGLVVQVVGRLVVQVVGQPACDRSVGCTGGRSVGCTGGRSASLCSWCTQQLRRPANPPENPFLAIIVLQWPDCGQDYLYRTAHSPH